MNNALKRIRLGLGCRSGLGLGLGLVLGLRLGLRLGLGFRGRVS